jgi:hypothetical protein
LNPKLYKLKLAGVVLLVCVQTADADTIGYWRFENGLADTIQLPGTVNNVADSSGLSNHGTLDDVANRVFSESGSGDIFGATVQLTGDPNTRSIRIDGTGAVDISSIDFGSGSKPYTLEFWMKHSSPGGFQDLFMTQSVNEVERGNNHGLHLNPTGDFQMFGNDGAVPPWEGSSPPLNQWIHVALTQNGSNTFELFLDGISQGTRTDSFHFNGLTIGYTDEQYGGFLDEIRVSDQVLLPSQFLGPVLFRNGFEASTQP